MVQETELKQKETFPRSFFVLLILLSCSLTFAIGVFFGKQQTVRALVPEGEGRVVNRDTLPVALEDDVDFQRFWDIWNKLKDQYVTQPLSDKQMYYGAVKGMVASLEDPYTVFFDPKDAQSFMENLEGSFSGIGAEIGIKDKQLQVIAPLPETPAERAGLKAGDNIYMIGEKSTVDMTVEEAVSLIRGPSGTQVHLVIGHEGDKEPTKLDITRDKIVIKSVRAEIDEKTKIQTITISTFNDDTDPLLSEAITKGQQAGVKGIILDLRNNPGGLLRSAIDISSDWVGHEVVVSEKDRENSQLYRGTHEARLSGIPTVVLVNGGSASASEIVTGALQDLDAARVVGEQTYGKGSVQNYEELPDGSALKMTIAHWFTPKGRSINKEGITPDVIVPFTIEDFHAKKDPQKQKALELLTHPDEYAKARTAKE